MLHFTEPLLQLTLAEHLSCHEVLLTRRDRLDHLIAEQASLGPWAPLIARLRCLRGIDTLTAIGLLTEVGDFTAFTHPRRLASFIGLVPSESSSGDRRRQGSITKCGSSHARRLLIEASWHYRRHPALSVDLRRRQANQPPAAIDAAWRAQLRLHRRWTHLDAARGKKRTTVAVAVARELAYFVWEIANQPDTALNQPEVRVAAGARNRDPRSRYEHQPTAGALDVRQRPRRDEQHRLELASPRISA